MKNLGKKLKSLIVSFGKNDINMEDVNENVNLENDLGYDSIMIIQIIAEIEDEFKIVFDDEDMDMDILTNYQKMLNLIKSKMNLN